MSKECPECPLVDPEGLLSSMVPSSFIIATNLEVKPVLIDKSSGTPFSMKNHYSGFNVYHGQVSYFEV